MKLSLKNVFKGDKVIWMIAVFLVLISLLVVYSASESYANRHYSGNNAYVLLRHSLMLAGGLVAMILASMVNYKHYSRIMWALFWISVPLLIYTLFFGKNYNDAQRVISLGKFTFQSSDLAKIATVGFLARIIVLKRDSFDSFKKVAVNIMLPVFIVVGLIFSQNLSTAAMLLVTSLVIMFLGKIKIKYILEMICVAIILGSMFVGVSMLLEKDNRSMTWVNRIERFVNPDKDGKDESDYQIIQSKIAIAKGGLIGLSPGKSEQRNVLPHPYSDFIYAIIIEEYGLVGGVVVLLLYLILLFRTTRIMLRAPNSFGALLAMGLAFSIVMQAFVNMGVAVGLFPVTGQPMPFVSMGGTSLLFTGLSFGIIISVTKEIEKNDERKSEVEVATADC
ncbi:MAG: FtsW/RodA/SpoVE family cell cycle protein [Candidatus Limimorpha sp.]